MAGGVNTVESLGSMTPEDLEAVPGIDPETVEAIQTAVNGYYGSLRHPKLRLKRRRIRRRRDAARV